MLVNLEHVRRTCYAAAASVGTYSPHAGNMYQAVLLDSEVYECPEIRDIRDYAGQFHTGLQILYRVYVLGKLQDLV